MNHEEHEAHENDAVDWEFLVVKNEGILAGCDIAWKDVEICRIFLIQLTDKKIETCAWSL